MATIDITPQTLSVRFTTGERIGGLLRHIEVPREAVVSAQVEADGVSAVKGLRAPGLGLPGRRLIGTWRRVGEPRRTAVCVSRQEPAVRVRLRGQKWDELLIGTADPEGVVAQLSR
jgi:hypothetical protein